mmetsp:Transcript_9491/g.31574  ORF Transcript_9491/g.31574 Transcript_9491/m.31574 type:complete len:385 (-) Transcript_9491:277-1431(-)
MRVGEGGSQVHRRERQTPCVASLPGHPQPRGRQLSRGAAANASPAAHASLASIAQPHVGGGKPAFVLQTPLFPRLAGHLDHPPPLVLRLAVLHRLQRVAQRVQLFKRPKLVSGLPVGDGLDGRHHGGGAARPDLAEGLELLPEQRPLLDGDAHVPGDVHQHTVGDGWKDGRCPRCHVRARRGDANQVGDRELLHVLVFIAVEVECGAEAVRLGVLERQQVGGVVTAGLDVPRSLGRRAVKFSHDLGVDALDWPLAKVVSDRYNRDHELKLGAGLQTQHGRRANQKGTDVQGAAGAVRWNVLCIGAHGPVYCFDEQHGRHRRHHQPIGAAAEPLGVCPEVADTDLAVLAAEGLATLKERHAVVKHARVHVQVHVRIADEPPRVPR